MAAAWASGRAAAHPASSVQAGGRDASARTSAHGSCAPVREACHTTACAVAARLCASHFSASTECMSTHAPAQLSILMSTRTWCWGRELVGGIGRPDVTYKAIVYIAMAYVVMAHEVRACRAVACIVMACIVMSYAQQSTEVFIHACKRGGAPRLRWSRRFGGGRRLFGGGRRLFGGGRRLFGGGRRLQLGVGKRARRHACVHA